MNELTGIGDLSSEDPGTARRFNAGKPMFSLVPVKVMAESILRRQPNAPAAKALFLLGCYQSTRQLDFVYEALEELGLDGWVECAQVFEYGRTKYASWNWAKGMMWSYVLDSACRHLLAMVGEGGYAVEDLDPESGLPHRGHVFCNLTMLIVFTVTYPNGDDLPQQGRLA